LGGLERKRERIYQAGRGKLLPTIIGEPANTTLSRSSKLLGAMVRGKQPGQVKKREGRSNVGALIGENVLIFDWP